MILAPPSFRYCFQKANPEQNFLKIIYLKSLSYGLAFLLKLNVSGRIIKRLDWFQSWKSDTHKNVAVSLRSIINKFPLLYFFEVHLSFNKQSIQYWRHTKIYKHPLRSLTKAKLRLMKHNEASFTNALEFNLFNPLGVNPRKWSNTLSNNSSVICRRIAWVCLTIL